MKKSSRKMVCKKHKVITGSKNSGNLVPSAEKKGVGEDKASTNTISEGHTVSRKDPALF